MKVMNLKNLVMQLSLSALTVPGIAAPMTEGGELERLFGERAAAITLDEIAAKGLEQGAPMITPWSGSYWPYYKGGIANRYLDSEYPQAKSWQTNYDYILETPPEEVVAAGRIQALSPAEKYDLLVGDTSFGLSSHAWAEGAKNMESLGHVPQWIGIDHGTAAASASVAAPRNSVTVMLEDGTLLIFTPSDISALASQLWAQARYPVSFLGSRCNEQQVETAPAAIRDNRCFDPNPAAWHLALVNRVGIQGESAFFDQNASNQVWNTAIGSYSFSYFKVNSGEPVGSYQDAMTEVGSWTDPYAANRRSMVRHVVGVEVEIQYPRHIVPTARTTKTSYSGTLTYRYDLEIDETGRIVGGEWHSNKRPDFLWYPKVDRVETVQDEQLLTKWDGYGPIPGEWKDQAKLASREGSPLAAIVEALMWRSAGN